MNLAIAVLVCALAPPIAVGTVTAPRPGTAGADRSRAAVVRLDEIDEDALGRAEYLLAIRGRWEGHLDGGARTAKLARALRDFASHEGLALPEGDALPGEVFERLGCAREVWLGWGGRGPRAPELSPDEVWRLNHGLAARGLLREPPSDVVTAETLDALRRFQARHSYRPQRSEVIDRIWLFRLGVATEEGSPLPDDDAGMSR
jgi:hypothetical protein